MSRDFVQDFIAFDEQMEAILPEAVPAATAAPSLYAQISMENAARLRFMERTGKTAPLLPGGATDAQILENVCEHCGQGEGKRYTVPYSARHIHLCPDCARQERQVAERMNTLLGLPSCRYNLPVLPSALRRPAVKGIAS